MNKEAREGGLLPLTPEITNSEGYVRLNSAGKLSTRASLTQPNSEQKILPHYLRASTGSCHDFCKYGRKHTFEPKGKHPILPGSSGISGTLEKEQSRVKIINVAHRQRKSAKQKASANQKTELYNRPEVGEEWALSPVEIVECTETQISNRDSLFPETKSSESSEFMDCNFPSPSEKIVSLEASATIMQDAPVESTELYDDPETVTQKTTPFLEKTEISEHSETPNKSKTSVRKIHLSLGPASVEQRTQSANKVFASVKTEVKQKALSSVKTAISPVLPTVSKKGVSVSKKCDSPVLPSVSKKEVSVSKKRDATVKPALSVKPTLKPTSLKNPTTGTASRKIKSKGVEVVEMSKSRQNKMLKPPSTSSSLRPPLNQVSNFRKSAISARHPRKVQKTPLDFDKIKEKTLYVIEPRSTQNRNFESAELKPSSCQLSLSSSSPSSSSPSVSNYKGEENQDVESAFIKPCSTSEHGGAKATKSGQKSQRRMATSHQEDKDSTPYKLKFRKGKVLNPPSDNSGMRQLRFRQGRRLGDDQSAKREVERRSFRRKQSEGGDLNHPDPKAQSVVLRRQDVQGKKDAPEFNQIIEETASKLVKTRKSKVKALVGAFETVISLQESKPAASA